MCGIAGVMMCDGRPLEPAVLDRLTAALAHRGPDGSGRYKNGSTGLINTRLAIIDLQTGDQPFEETKGAVLVANGEIYNDLEIRRRLSGATYESNSDCESPLHLYRREGLAFTDHLRGMYAIAIYDRESSKLILARDPFGIKQLYYIATATHFAFASEPQALIAAGLARVRVNQQKRAELFQLKFTTGPATIFAQIHRLLPGETIVVSGGQIVERRQQRVLSKARPPRIGYAHAAQRIDDVLSESVALHVRSDVPYGLFLSGGIDSSALAVLMSRISSNPIMALTAGFPGSRRPDESDAARRVARAVNADHQVVEVTADAFWASAPKVAAALDDPTADASALPTYLLGRAAKEANLKVVLSGEGADEMFGGYSRYRRALWLWGLMKRKSRTHGVFNLALDKSHALDRWRDGLAAAERTEVSETWSHMQALQAVDCAEWLPNDLLVKLDRCLMAHGVEGRTPYLDTTVAPFGFGLPDDLKVKHKRGKWLLRDWLSKALPAANSWAKKTGFNPPVGEWIESRKATIEPLILAQPGIAEMSITDLARAVFADPIKHSQAAWNLVFYALWHSHHVLGVAADGAVDDVLAGAARSG